MSSPVPSPRQPKKVLRLGPLYRSGGTATPEAERLTNSINQIMRQTRSPFGELRKFDNAEVVELEKSLRELETRLGEHEQANHALQGQLAERERDLWETEALLKAREEVLQAERKRASALAKAASATAGPSTEEIKAYEKLKAELDAQEETLKEAKAQLREREEFLEEAENQLMMKMAAQQEKEVELEQREEDWRNREKKFRQEAGLPPLPEKQEPRETA
jgi:chromosome segregation ATPase